MSLAILTLAMAVPAFGQSGTEPLLLQTGSKLVGAGASAHAGQGNAAAISADGNTAVIGAYSDTLPGSAAIFTNVLGVWTQQGAKLVGTGGVGNSLEGYAAAISGDGNTVILGGESDNGNAGAVWIFIQNAAVWTQQGTKLVGTGAAGGARQGWSAAMSADGNTALVGGPRDNGGAGATWVFTRSGGVWTQQGGKLVGTGAVGLAAQGNFVALSGDGNTALIGGPFDNSDAGAAWVFTRSAGVWTQQGSKLVGTGATGAAEQGYSVGLSADGNTALIGGQTDNSSGGAAWAFIRSSGVWSQQGSKLVPSDAVGTPQFGVSVALSADGNKAVVGGFTDNSANGAIWAFTRSGSVWTQQGGKVVTSDGVEPSLLGYSVGLSADGGTAIAGGLNDNNGVGAAWMFSTGTAFGALNIGAVETANIDVPWSSNFTLGSIAVLTGGAAGLDFTLPGQVEGDCEIGFTYAPGESCPVTIQFSPTVPGLRTGAVLFYDNSAPPVLIATVYLNGIGLGPQIGFVSGLIATTAGTGVQGYTGDGGLATAARLDQPYGLAIDGAGNLYIAAGAVVREVNAITGIIATVAGTGTAGYSGDGGLATSGQIGPVFSLAVDGAGNLYIADSSNFVVRRVDGSTGIITTVAGVGTSGYDGDGGPATSAHLGHFFGIAVDRRGSFYIVDDVQNVIRKVDSNTGIIATIVGVAGGGGYSGDGGPALAAELSYPLAPVLDAAGNLYFADDNNNAIRVVSATTGIITTVAGNGTAGYLGDGGLATSAKLSDPEGLTLDAAGNLYIADSSNFAIRKVSASTGIITTIAGTPTFSGYVGDGGPANQALFGYPANLVLDHVGNLYLADDGNNVIREIFGIAPVDLGSVAVGSVSNAQDVAVTNNGNLPLTLTSLSPTASFSLNGPDTTCTGGPTLNPGDSCVLGIEFAPIVGGSQTGAINLVDNAGSQSVNLAGTGIPLSTTTTLSSSLNPSSVGQSVTFTATVATVEPNLQGGARRVPTGHVSPDGGGGPPAEMVSFYDGSTLLGTVTAVSGVATLTTSNLIVGAHNITAVFLGNAAYITSTSAILVQVVTGIATTTTTTLTVSPNPANAGGIVTFTATIAPAPTGNPTGTVAFYSGSTLLGTATVDSSGVATFTSVSLATGALSITAVYSGNTGFAGSTSLPIIETVNTSFTVTGPPAPVTVQEGGSVAINVTVPPLGGAFDNVVTMSASGLPPGATATFNPPTVTPGSAGAPTILTIQLAAVAASAIDPHRKIPFASFVFAIGLCGFGLRRRRFSGKCRQVLALAVLAGTAFVLTTVLTTMTACGGGFAGPPTTHPGSFIVTITGTSGSIQASTTVTVVVR